MLVDLGGGVMTVARGDQSQIDTLVVVVEPYPRSMEVARRLLTMAEGKNIHRRFVVANKIEDDEDLRLIREEIGVDPDVILPRERAVQLADRSGNSLIDHDPSSVSMQRLRQLAGSLIG